MELVDPVVRRRSCRALPTVVVRSLAILVGWAGPVEALQQPSAAPPPFVAADDLEAVLPQSSVYDILEDHQGFLWFATREGVARWDGREVRSWRHDPFDPASLPGNVARFMVQDAAGDIWVTTLDYLELPTGIARILAPSFTQVRRYDVPRGRVALDRDGRALAITPDSILAFDGEEDRFRSWLPRALPDTPDSQRYQTINTLTTKAGELWISSMAGLERCTGAPRARCEAVERGTVEGGPLLEGPEGGVWSVAANHVVRRDGEGTAHTVALELDTPITALAADSAGALWVLSEAGVDRIVDGRWTSRSPFPRRGDRRLAPVALQVDRAQNVWVGTVWGAFVHARARKAFQHLGHVPDDPSTLAAALVAALEEGPDGAIWIGTIGGGLHRWHRTTGKIERFQNDPSDPSSLPADVVWDLHAGPEGRVWIATSDGLAAESPSGDFDVFRRVPLSAPAAILPQTNTIQDLQFDGEGRLWTHCSALCGDSLSWFDPSTGDYGGLPIPDLRAPGYAGLDPEGVLWVGTADGIRLVDPRTHEQRRLDGVAGLDGVLAFHFSSTGDTWVGANSGLYRFSPARALVERFTTRDGLPSNAVYGILEDQRRRLWMSTNRGLAMIDLDEPEGQRIRTFDRTTGVENVEFNRNAFLETRDGTLFFGGDRGVTWFHPGDIVENRYAPPVVVTSLERTTGSGPVREYLGGPLPAVLAPEDDTFSFEFAALSYINPHRNRFRVTLEGFDESWRELGSRGRATYTNVPPGDYTFRVQGSNEDGVWGPAEARVAVRVEPWFWETAWFRIAMALLLAAAVAGVGVGISRARYRAQLARLRAEQALDRERARLSRDMHDEVGASLTEIAILSEVARADERAGDRARDRLARIGGKSREALDSISGIIWAIDPHRERGSVAPYLREYASEVLESADLEAVFDFPPAEGFPVISAESRRTLRLVLKEALTNVIRHAGARRVQVGLSAHPDSVRLSVADDGHGMGEVVTVRSRPGHDGIRNMMARAEAAGGRLDVESPVDGPGHDRPGTRVVLTVPLAREDFA